MRLGLSNPSQDGQDDWHLVASHGICWAFLWAATRPAFRAGQAGQAHQAATIGAWTGGALMPLLRSPAPAPLFNCLDSQRSFLSHSQLSSGWWCPKVDLIPPFPLHHSPVDHPNRSSMLVRWD